MKFFWVNCSALVNIKLYACLLFITVFYSCATYHPQFGKEALVKPTDSLATRQLAHRFYLVGDAGYANQPNSQELLTIIKNKLQKEDKNTTLLYLGDNIYPLGMPVKDHKGRKEAEASLNSQLELAKFFNGKTYFIPGNHDWYHGLNGLEEQEKLVRHALGKKAFLPGNGCGINDVKINDSITLVTIDSQWFIEDWNDYPTINDDCSIKTRDALFTELESLLNKNQDKTIVLAIHHPLTSGGTHGGQFSLDKQLFPIGYNIPLPGIGSFANLLRKTSGGSPQDGQSRIYSSLANRIKTLIQDKNNVVVVSGHDHNLQYIFKDNIHQIISGAGSKVEAARAMNPQDFTFGGTGYAILDIYKNGLAKVSYFKPENGNEVKLFEKLMLNKPAAFNQVYPDAFPPTTQASVYTPQMTKKSSFHRFLFGEHYRKYYSMPVTVKNVSLDTLYGGLLTGRAGGGHQSNSLRLLDKKEREYVMRGLKKSTTRFLQAVAFKQRYIGDEFEDTFAEDFLSDFYTTNHPYTPFIIDDLEETAGIYHTNPELYYIPKQPALNKYNKTFGGELYMVEERPTDEFKKLDSFGNPDAIEGTDDVYKNLAKDKKYTLDERAYIRVRLFDMLIGDWDRHGDQWRWARLDGKDSIVYKPIPRDRDQAFSKYDGAIMGILMNIPALRHMKDYKDDIKSVKWLNREPYPQDLAFITKSDESVWIEEAKFLQQTLTDAAIDKAFATLPLEMLDETIEDIKTKMKSRREQLANYAVDYRNVLLRTVLLTGTDKKEKFVITRLPKGNTEVKIYSIKKDSETLVHSKTYNKKKTKEIWIYGLDDDDIFEVKGKGDKFITLRLLGGQNNDTYTIEQGKDVIVYDFKSKKNEYATDKYARLVLTDDYETNSYNPDKPAYSVVAGNPSVGYNPDDGVKAGAVVNYTVNNFNRRPYSQKHTVKAEYFFATHGFDLSYRGVFMNVASRWNFALDARFTSPNFSINYFGYGNETKNYDDDFGMNYNRVKLQIFRVSPSFFSQGRNGSFIEIKTPFETIEVDGDRKRFVNQPGVLDSSLYEHRQYGGVQATYKFENFDHASLPALGMSFSISGGWKASFDEFERNFAHLESGLTFIHKITRNNNLVVATTLKTKILFNNNYEFYQAATLGGDNDLRGYRRERFTGKEAFYQSSDLRLTLAQLKSFIPMKVGILGGYDYGRVWVDNESSSKWHQSVGGGLWLNGAEVLTVRATYFRGSDGGRVAVGLQFGL
jgi:hypothetical protein